MRYWKSLWKYLTFGQISSDILPPSSRLYDPESEFACQLRDEFGPRFLELARPLWEIQKSALRASGFMKPAWEGIMVQGSAPWPIHDTAGGTISSMLVFKLLYHVFGILGL
jgi:hypothetical protein